MIVYSVSVQVVDGHEEDFKEATRINHKETRKESGNLRFDILQSEDDPCKFMLYEVYRSDEAVAAHKETAHYKVWRKTVAPWMAKDREGKKFIPFYPKDSNQW